MVPRMRCDASLGPAVAAEPWLRSASPLALSTCMRLDIDATDTLADTIVASRCKARKQI